MNKILVITYYWPPGSSPGIQRWLKLSKYLIEFGWEVHLLTVANGSYPSIDSSLLEEVDKNIVVYKARTIEPFWLFNRLRGKNGNEVAVGLADISEKKSFFQKVSNFVRANFFIPDARKFWVPFASQAAKKIIEVNGINLIVTTGPPHSSHLIGMKLKRWNKDLFWHADFRDPWTSIYYNEFLMRTKLAQSWDNLLEEKVLKAADLVTVIGNQMKSEFVDKCNNISVIYNGYDESEFSERLKPQSTDIFIIKYIGGLKSNQNVLAFWESIYTLVHLRKIQNIRVELTGYINLDIHQLIIDKDLSSYVIINGFVNHNQAISLMKSANMLLLIIPKSKNNKQIITGKIFEYLATRIPILAIGPEGGDADFILQSCQRPQIIDFGDDTGIVNAIFSEYKKWEKTLSQNFISKENNLHEQFTRRNQALKLCREYERFIDKIDN